MPTLPVFLLGFLAPINCSKIPALVTLSTIGSKAEGLEKMPIVNDV
jgi:hypothetical protein